MSEVTISRADYDDPEHAAQILFLTNEYAKDEMGGGEPLPAHVQQKLVAGLRNMPTAFTLLAFEGDKAVGLANCVVGYSTFKAAPLVNIHDITVLPTHRGRGIGRLLIDAVEAEAKSRGCSQITLEVRADNDARRLYLRAGFKMGTPEMFFMKKSISL